MTTPETELQRLADGRTDAARLADIRATLYPSDPTYCAEPLDIDDARWLLNYLDLCGYLADLK